jgi:SAM-dependent methyltransferase
MKPDQPPSSPDYRDYVIRNGRFIGRFEDMYRDVEDPWHIGDATSAQYDLILSLILRRGICREPCQVLDLGCGKGAFTGRLKQALPGAAILALEISETAIAAAKRSVRFPGVEFRVMDLRREFRGLRGEYDLVLMSQLAWYILPELREILGHLTTGVLKHGGYLLVNQAFYRGDEQTYGKEILSTVEELVAMVGLPLLDLIETDRLSNHNAILLFRRP